MVNENSKMEVDNLLDMMSAMMCKRSKVEQEHEQKCKLCGSLNNATNSDFEIVCTDCGTVDESVGRIDQTAEWTSSYTDEKGSVDKSRVGMPQNHLYNEWGNGTVIAYKRGMSVSERRMVKINSHISSNHKDRALHQTYEDIQESCRMISLNQQVVDIAKEYYKKISEGGITRGKVRLGMKANCVYFACKKSGYPRSLHEIAEAFNITAKDISKTQRKFREVLGVDDTQNIITMASDMVKRIISGICQVDGKIVMDVVNLTKKMQVLPEFMGKSGRSIAGACICYKLGISVDIMSENIDVSKLSIKKLIMAIENVEHEVKTVKDLDEDTLAEIYDIASKSVNKVIVYSNVKNAPTHPNVEFRYTKRKSST